MNIKTYQKKKKKITFRKIVSLIIIIFLIYIFYQLLSINHTIDNPTKSTVYKVIKQDKNNNYEGLGQQKFSRKDGYFTTFTTGNNHKKTYKEYKQNGTASWSENEYWNTTMSESGCGITAMSIILSGYQKNITPEDLRRKYAPILNYEKLPQELSSTYHIKNSGFYYDTTHLSNKAIEDHLLTNRPIIICVWNKPTENRWTTASHYMVLLAADGQGMVYISNPNGLENDSKSSGWYDINEITPYIAKAIYIESYT